MVSRSDLPYVAMMLFGVLLLVTSTPELIDGGFVYEVTDASEDDFEHAAENETDSGHAYQFIELSPTAKQTFLDALRAEDGTTTVQEENRPTTFETGDVADEYFVSYDGEYYRLTGSVKSGDIPDLVAGIVALFGTLSVVVPIIDMWRHREQTEPI